MSRATSYTLKFYDEFDPAFDVGGKSFVVTYSGTRKTETSGIAWTAHIFTLAAPLLYSDGRAVSTTLFVTLNDAPDAQVPAVLGARVFVLGEDGESLPIGRASLNVS